MGDEQAADPVVGAFVPEGHGVHAVEPV